jgi:DNA-binding phage protein
MSLEARTKEKFAKRAARFIDKRKAQLGCAKAAMADVARKVGMSVASLYRIVNNHPKPAKIQAHHHAALLMHTLGIVKAAASRMGRKRHATISPELSA